MVIRSTPGTSGTVGSVELKGCGVLHTSMLSWQDCAQCRDLPKYAAWKGQPRFVEPPPPPKPKVEEA